jgi:hypothetical protein
MGLARDRPWRRSNRRLSSRPGRRREHEAKDVLRRELDTPSRPKRVDAERAQILVEVAKPGRQCDRLDAGRLRPSGQGDHRGFAGSIGIAGDLDPPQPEGKDDGGEVIGRERRH